MSHIARQRPVLLLRGSRSTVVASSRRAFSSSASTSADEPSAGRSPSDRGGKPSSGGGAPRRLPGVFPEYKDWIEGDGRVYRRAPPGRGPFWLGPTPFPLNPSFRPPPPTAHRIKRMMWDMHTADPVAHSVRVLSTRFGIPIERTQAILRLMALEHEFQRAGKPLQMPFQKEMERLTGSAQKPELIHRETQLLEKAKSGFKAFEDLPLGGKDAPSIIGQKLAEEQDKTTALVRNHSVGGVGPKMIKGAAKETVRWQSEVENRTPFLFVDISDRPTSYQGVGTLEENVKRATKQRTARDRRRANDDKWRLRTELAKRIEAGEQTPELLEQKRVLDAEKVEEDAQIKAVLRKQYRSGRKAKSAQRELTQLKAERERIAKFKAYKKEQKEARKAEEQQQQLEVAQGLAVKKAGAANLHGKASDAAEGGRDNAASS